MPESWLGFAVDDVEGRPVGTVRGLFADTAGGEPAWLLVAPRRRLPLLSRRSAGLVALPLRDCAAAAGRVWTGHSHQAVRAAPTVDPSRPLLREHELAICAHYGIGERVGRASEVVGRPLDSVTAAPAAFPGVP